MKYLMKLTFILSLSLLLVNCSKDDDVPTNQNLLLGKWVAVSGSLLDGWLPQYMVFNNDNTLNFLTENSLGFKHNFEVDYSYTQFDVTIVMQGNITYQYSLDGETLTLTLDAANIAVYRKSSTAPNPGEWVQELSVLSQGDAPWSGKVEIAFTYDKTKILYGMNNSASYIPLISPETFQEVGQIESTSEARVVEIDKFEDEPFRFESSGDSDLITYYSTATGDVEGNIEMVDQVSGLASVNGAQIWISNNDNYNLYLYNYVTDAIDEQINIGLTTNGLDYQNGYLYISDGLSLHKCKTSPEFQVVTSYAIPEANIYGIANDGNNFWVNAYTNDGYKIIKTNLTL